MPSKRKTTKTSAFGSPGRAGHDSSAFYAGKLYDDQLKGKEAAYLENPIPAESLDRIFNHSAEAMRELPDNSVHLMVSSPPYNVGKAMMEELARTLAREEQRHGVHVNVVAPGLVVSDMGQRLTSAVMGLDDMTELDPSSPFGHVCRPEEVAAVVVALCGPAGAYVTGQRIEVDGGGFTPAPPRSRG